MRTKKQIISDYKDLLESKGMDVSSFSDSELMELLIEGLYETEDYNGKKISSLNAWYLFVNIIVRYDIKTKTLLWNKLVEKLYLIWERHNLSSTLCSRGHGKTITSTLYILFKQYLFDGVDVLWVNNIPAMGKRNLRGFKRFVDANELVMEKKREDPRNPKWSDQEVEYNEGIIETISVGSTPRGAHVHLICVDDPLRDDNRYSKSHYKNFILAQLLPALMALKGRMIITSTPQSEDDILHEVMNSKNDFQGELIRDGSVSALGFASYVLPAILNYETKEVLVPERYTFEQLMNIRRTIGDLRFSKEYMVRVVPEDSQIFPEGIIRGCIDKRLDWQTKGTPGKIYYIGVDLAISATKRADFTCFVVVEYNEETSVKIVREVINEKMTAEEQEERLVNLARMFNNAYVFIEKNNMGEFLRQNLLKHNVNVEGFTTTRLSKQNFINFLRTELVNKKILFPPLEGPYECVKTQLLSFGYKESRGKQVMEALIGHDDIVDALGAANIATQNQGPMESTAIFVAGSSKRKRFV